MKNLVEPERQREERMAGLALRIAEAQEEERRAVSRGYGDVVARDATTGKVIKRPRKTIFQVARERGLQLEDDIPDVPNVK